MKVRQRRHFGVSLCMPDQEKSTAASAHTGMPHFVHVKCSVIQLFVKLKFQPFV